MRLFERYEPGNLVIGLACVVAAFIGGPTTALTFGLAWVVFRAAQLINNYGVKEVERDGRR